MGGGVPCQLAMAEDNLTQSFCGGRYWDRSNGLNHPPRVHERHDDGMIGEKGRDKEASSSFVVFCSLPIVTVKLHKNIRATAKPRR